MSTTTKAPVSDAYIIRKIRYGVMGNQYNYLAVTLWRLSSGNRAKAFDIVRECATRYGLTREQIKDFHIDCALGELNDGVEVEWNE